MREMKERVLVSDLVDTARGLSAVLKQAGFTKPTPEFINLGLLRGDTFLIEDIIELRSELENCIDEIQAIKTKVEPPDSGEAKRGDSGEALVPKLCSVCFMPKPVYEAVCTVGMDGFNPICGGSSW